jgi:hypothetical protein
MKTPIALHLGALRRALYTLMLGIAALWTMPELGSAQLYISQTGGGGNTAVYHAGTRAAINPSLVTAMGSSYRPTPSGNTLYFESNAGSDQLA